MKTKIIIGASAAFFCIDSPGRSLNLLLPSGKGAIDGMEEIIKEEEEKLNRLIGRIAAMKDGLANFKADQK